MTRTYAPALDDVSTRWVHSSAYAPEVTRCTNRVGSAGITTSVQTTRNASTDASYRCGCPEGYRKHSYYNECVDENECEQSPCSFGECINTLGSFKCGCSPGFQYDHAANMCTMVWEKPFKHVSHVRHPSSPQTWTDRFLVISTCKLIGDFSKERG
ncbi:unnamed protein product [Nesidiocoris tenuis]|uniref:EGF-like domain-containing protein n=1 Tax=Nesidiocoris tenuis TaxID=355587 RepID=A0A6H5G6P2_9HEMI|nr:unnamed protein product [Nesidiocoris tenuis]